MKKLSILAASLMMALAVQAEPEKTEETLVLPVMAQASHHATASKRITALFTRSHYVPVQLDDELSGRIFDMYLKNLDYYRNVLLKSDVEAFSRFRDQFDDGLNKGNLNFAFDMFNQTLERRAERFDFAISLLAQEFDFSKDDSYQYDREDAQWPADQAEMD